jgi:predicted HTH domain antitoxin
MKMTFDVPVCANISQPDGQIIFATALFQAGKISIGKAAEMAGLSYRSYWDLLHRYNIPAVTYSEDEIMEEIQNALNIK